MNVSEVIQMLQELSADYGDIPVSVCTKGTHNFDLLGCGYYEEDGKLFISIIV